MPSLANQCEKCDTLRFWSYFLGSSLEAKHYISTLSITDETGKQKYVFQGEVFTLDKNDPHGGFLLSWNTTLVFDTHTIGRFQKYEQCCFKGIG